MSFNECFRCVELAVNSDGISSVAWPPKEFVWFEMEVGVGGGSGDFLPDYRRQLAMMKGSCVKHFFPRVRHPTVKGYIDPNRCFDPVSIMLFVLPVRASYVLSAQSGINKLPIIPRNVFWAKGRVSNYFEEFFET